MSKAKALAKVTKAVIKSQNKAKANSKAKTVNMKKNADGSYSARGTKTTSKSASGNRKPGIVSQSLERRHEYRMTHGKAIEASKAVRDAGASVAGSSAAESYADAYQSKQSSEAKQAAESADVQIAKAYADALKNRSYTEKKDITYNINGVDTILNGGATKAVDPATGKKEYDV